MAVEAASSFYEIDTKSDKHHYLFWYRPSGQATWTVSEGRSAGVRRRCAALTDDKGGSHGRDPRGFIAFDRA